MSNTFALLGGRERNNTRGSWVGNNDHTDPVAEVLGPVLVFIFYSQELQCYILSAKL